MTYLRNGYTLFDTEGFHRVGLFGLRQSEFSVEFGSLRFSLQCRSPLSLPVTVHTIARQTS